MVNAEWWLDDEFPNTPAYNGSVVGEPEINYTDNPLEKMQANLVARYNEVHELEDEAALTLDDFEWTEVERPEPLEQSDDDVRPDVEWGSGR